MAYDSAYPDDEEDLSYDDPSQGALASVAEPQLVANPEARDYAKRILDQGLTAKDQTPELLADLSKNAEAAREVLRQARQRLMARKQNITAQRLLAMSAAYSKPSANYGETMGNVANSVLDQEKQIQAGTEKRDSDIYDIDSGMVGVDDKLLASKLKLLQLQSRNNSGLMTQALKTMSAPGGTSTKPVSTYGKIAEDEGLPKGTPEYQRRVSQLRSEDLAAKYAQAGIDAPRGGAGAEEGSDDLHTRLGVPKAVIDPYAGLSTKAKLQMQNNEMKKAEATLAALDPTVATAQQGIQDVQRFMELNKNQPSGGLQGSIPVLHDVVSWATGFSKEAKEMDAITSRMSRQMRVPGEGQTSDFDAKQFIKGTIGRDKPYETNKNIAAGYLAQQQRTMERAQFMNDYFTANGHLRGAQSAWMKYMNANPIFDPKAPGSYKLNKTRKTYQQFFGRTDSGDQQEGYAEGGEVEPSSDSDPQLLQSMLQGATFGLGDEGLAALQSGPTASNLKNERASLLRSESSNPLSSAGAQAAGTATTLITLGKLIAKNKGVTDAALRLIPDSQLIKLALAGATSGGLMGFGAGEDSDRMGTAIQTSALGTGAGVLGGLAAKYSLSGLENLLDRVRGQPISGAEKRLSAALGEEGGDPSKKTAEVARLRRSGVPATLLDVGNPRLRALAEAAASRQVPESEGLVNDLANRAVGTRERVGERVNKALKPDEYFSQLDKLQEDLRTNAQPLYQKAYEAHPSISSPTLMSLLDTPDGQKALRMGMRLAGNRQMGITPEGLKSDELTPLQQLEKSAKDAGLFEAEDPTPEQRAKESEWLKNYKATQTLGDQPAQKVAPGLPLEFYDYVKRGFDQLVNTEEKQGPSTLGHSIRGLRNALRSELDRATTDDKGSSPYADARKQYAGDLEVLDALKTGREDFNRLTPEEVNRTVKDMSFAEKDAFRSGVAQHLFEKIAGPTSDINAARKVIGSPATTAKLEPLFDTPSQFNLFKTALEKEMEMYDKSKSVVSRAERAGASQAGRGESLLEKIEPGLHSTPWGFTPTTWTLNLLRQSPTMSNDTANEISKALRTTDPSELKALGERLTKVSTRLKGRANRAGKAGIIGAAITGALAAPSPKGKNLEEGDDDGE